MFDNYSFLGHDADDFSPSLSMLFISLLYYFYKISTNAFNLNSIIYVDITFSFVFNHCFEGYVISFI